MIHLLRPQLVKWDAASGAKIIVGMGEGRAFCAGGDVRAVVKAAASDDPKVRATAGEYFKEEFELDHQLASFSKPYVAIMDGITMGGGMGLSMHAPFRIATEKTQIAMPETKIGYAPDVGATYFLPKLDGKLGTYLALTGRTVKGRGVYELGIATHFVPSERIPLLRERLALLNPQNYDAVEAAVAEYACEDYAEFETDLVGDVRAAIDEVFAHPTVEAIVAGLRKVQEQGGELEQWVSGVLADLDLRSPTALKVALEAQRVGKGIKLREALLLEQRFATAFCNGATQDFITGVRAVLEEKTADRPAWEPATLDAVDLATVRARFFRESEYTKDMRPLEFLPEPFEGVERGDPMRYALPTEAAVEAFIKGEGKAAGAFAVTFTDAMRHFDQKTNGKPGVAAKVAEIIGRRATMDEEQYLKWRH
ncbi:ClpP/crotonase [Calocera cornea HHB12733]|uniref:3-hydroxyisobutyryl-CoA hydrolase n=1 Tax=Calocera cornea HHB12733 TaxID=1353952 RepID=A0A165JAD5_9BASI|nr:ClpP/crotonase [Calocera cornea HHB12733]